MKSYFSIIAAAFLLCTACAGDEDTLVNRIDFSSPYVIEDDASDPVQHHRFQIYEKYGVPVFFNDTIASAYVGEGYDGKPIYRYETLDFNWSFSSNNKTSVTYRYEYMEDAELQEKALQFVDRFLEEASKPMRPFSIFLPESFLIKKSGQPDESPEFWTGFRTLVIPEVHKVKTSEIPAFSSDILRSMVKDRVLASESVSSAFGEISSTENYYNKLWVNELNCVWGVVHKGVLWNPGDLFARGVENTYISQPWSSNVSTREEFYAERDLIMQQIGRFGFICGNIADRRGQNYSPRNVKEDMEFFLDNMLSLGSTAFEERYCAPAAVNEKYLILAEYIRESLGVEF